MLTSRNPTTIAPPFSPYSHAVEAPPGARWLYISGQVGVRPDGSLAEGPAAQIEQTWRNILAILDDAGMSPADLVRVNGYLIQKEHVTLYRDVRDAMLDGARPASTLLFISGLAHPEWLVEIEAVAAKAG